MKNSLVFSLSTPVGRREFIKRTGLTLGAVSLSGVLAEIVSSCSSSTQPQNTSKPAHGSMTINIANLTSDGDFVVSNSPGPDGMPILIIRQNSSTFTALSMLCTHEICQVGTPSAKEIYCPCHGSRFDLHGNVLEGPASAPLATYALTLDATAQTVTVTY